MSEFELLSVQVGQPRSLGWDDLERLDGRTWTSAILKHPVEGPVWLGAANLEGDGQAELDVHGGPHKAVLGYSADHYSSWRSDFPEVHWEHGHFGENFTIRGLDEFGVAIGDTFCVGDAVVQVSEPRGPCWKLARRVGIRQLAARVRANYRGGWYFRVLQEGRVEAGQKLRLVESPFPQWTIAKVLQIRYDLAPDPLEVDALAGCPLLSPHWRVRSTPE